MALVDGMTESRAYSRRHADCRVFVGATAWQHHRSAHDSLIDYTLPKITSGTARGMSTAPGFALDKPGFRSSWHYHDCIWQISIVLKGSGEKAFYDNAYSRVSKGDVAFIPGNVIHDVRKPSADYQVAEFIFSETFATVEASTPRAGEMTVGRTWGRSDAVRSTCLNGLVCYVYPVSDPVSRSCEIEYERSSPLELFRASRLPDDRAHRFLLLITGQRTMAIDDVATRAETGDLLVLPAGAGCQDVGVSEDYEGVWISNPHL